MQRVRRRRLHYVHRILWRLFNTGRKLRVLEMSETMKEMMEREKAEAIATLNRANRALSRIFGIDEEGEGDE